MTDSSLPLSNSSSHVGWIDLLRVVACVAVVLAHNCDAFVGQFLVDPVSFYTGAAIGSLMRPSVPLFVMITAVLLLPVRSTITLPSFYRRRVGRIVVPLIFCRLLCLCSRGSISLCSVPALRTRLSTFLPTIHHLSGIG